MHKASVTSVAFDPLAGHVVASGSADGKVIITSCFNNELDAKQKASGPFAAVNTDAETVFEFKNEAWVNYVGFSQSG